MIYKLEQRSYRYKYNVSRTGKAVSVKWKLDPTILKIYEADTQLTRPRSCSILFQYKATNQKPAFEMGVPLVDLTAIEYKIQL